jgi:hypothetical protein
MFLFTIWHSNSSPSFLCPTHAQTFFRGVFQKLLRTQNGSDKERRCFAFSAKMQAEYIGCDNLKTRNNYSLHVQEEVLCKRMNQRWLSINLLYKSSLIKVVSYRVLFPGVAFFVYVNYISRLLNSGDFKIRTNVVFYMELFFETNVLTLF